MKRLILLLALVLTFVMQLSAQVAIGPGAPNLKSILDLSSTAKFLVLPVSTTAPDATLLDTVGAMIFYNGNIYLRTPSGIKVFTPWKWDGTNSVSSDSAKPVGIGTIPSSHSFRLQVADAAAPGVSVTASSTASIAIGIKSTNHLLIDNDEIMVKKDTTTADTLSFQKNGGVLAIRTSARDTVAAVLSVNGSINASQKGKIMEHDNALLPPGSIVMWNKTTIPAGWALCNGSSYPSVLNPANLLPTPDLRNKFVVSAGNNALVTGAAYSLRDTGGINSSSHTHSIDPPSVSTFGGSHLHSGTTDGSDKHRVCGGAKPVDFSSAYHTHNFTTDFGGSHTHVIDIPVLGASNASSTSENRPPYYALIFIMKL